MNNIKKPQNGLALFVSLCLGKLPLNPLWHSKLYRCKFFLRSIFINPITFCWLNRLASYPQLGGFLSRQTNLPCKLQRPYLCSNMDNKMRLNALTFHYDFMASKPLFTEAVYGESPYVLAELVGKNDYPIKLSIHAADKFSREGEVTLYLYSEGNHYLSALTFSIINYENRPTLFIAGLQGMNSPDARQQIQQATKACYGLFPKRVLAEVALNLANNLQLKQVVAVSNQTHIYNNWRYKNKHKQVYFDYDDFWLTLNGELDPQNIFVLPDNIERKSIEEIASKKRSEYKNRYILLDNLSNEIKQQLSQLI